MLQNLSYQISSGQGVTGKDLVSIKVLKLLPMGHFGGIQSNTPVHFIFTF